ncbi:BRCT domain-containing protein [Neofusicoccum parvum]|uniref:BRCT domain-containing protein n=1 Tax=Neofusicoccum parvum TaxID=310453 RepID=A0ACB5SL55_9PEZI|nr:BRCT domain-containing protein [Neofusicoccum parvum]
MLVITDVRREPPVKGDLFAGKRFWIAQRCPSRADFVKRVTYNGGHVVPLEKNADYLIVDHVRKDLPPGGISYRFIEKSIEHEALQDPADALYACGPAVGSVREVASTQGVRRSKHPFTHQDDVELYNWVKDCEARGAAISGNEIYKDLERRNNRHSWQSWRDHYIKILRHKPPKTVSANPPPSPPSDPQPAGPIQPSRQSESAKKPGEEPVKIKPSPNGKQSRVSPSPPTAPSPTYEPKEPTTWPAGEPLSKKAACTLKDFDKLLANAESAMEVADDRTEDAWKAWAKAYPSHSAGEWYEYFNVLGRTRGAACGGEQNTS